MDPVRDHMEILQNATATRWVGSRLFDFIRLREAACGPVSGNAGAFCRALNRGMLPIGAVIAAMANRGLWVHDGRRSAGSDESETEN